MVCFGGFVKPIGPSAASGKKDGREILSPPVFMVRKNPLSSTRI